MIIPLGAVMKDTANITWTYIGSRITSVGTTEHVWARVLNMAWPHTLWTYKATKEETIKRKFPEL